MFADETSNNYKMNTKDDQKLPKENITVTYKKATIKLEKAITSEAKSTTKKLELSDRIYYLARSPTYIILKDKPTRQLINPRKNKIIYYSTILKHGKRNPNFALMLLWEAIRCRSV